VIAFLYVPWLGRVWYPIGEIFVGPIDTTIFFGDALQISIFDTSVKLQLGASIAPQAPGTTWVAGRSLKANQILTLPSFVATKLPWVPHASVDASLSFNASFMGVNTGAIGYPVVRLQGNELAQGKWPTLSGDIILTPLKDHLLALTQNISAINKALTSITLNTDLASKILHKYLSLQHTY
jgi:hypothetical protein